MSTPNPIIQRRTRPTTSVITRLHEVRPAGAPGAGRPRRALDDTVELAEAARDLISDAARRRTAEIVEGARIGAVLAIPIREAFRAAVDRELVTLKREREGLVRSLVAAGVRA